MITIWSEYRHALQRDQLNNDRQRVLGLTQLIPSTWDTYRTDTTGHGQSDSNTALQQLAADAFQGNVT